MAKSSPKESTKVSMNGSDPGITPLGDRALVKPLSPEEAGTKSPSGIIIPDSAANESKDRGIVLAVGPGRRGEDGKVHGLSVKKGDKIIFQWGEKVEMNGDEYFLVTENNILALLK